MYISERYPWFHRCRQHCTWISNYAKNLEIFKNSELENIESLFNVMNMIAGNSELKNLFPQRFREPIVGEIHIEN